MPGKKDSIDEEYKPQNTNTATTTETGLDTIYACVTMIDVAEGDSYVVDLKHQLHSDDPSAWRRYLIDAGKKKKETSRLEAICNSLYRNSGDHIKLGGPWNESPRINDTYRGTNIPPLSGIMITHSNADHAGGAPAVLERLSSLSAAQTPLWTIDIILKTQQSIMDREWGSLQDCCKVTATAHYNGDNYLEDVELRLDSETTAGYSVSKSWRTLDELASQAGYRVMYRFNLITEAKPDAKEAFTVVAWERIKSDHGTQEFFLIPKSSLKKLLCNVDAIATERAEPQLRKVLDDLVNEHGENVKILVEVILRPGTVGLDIKRTLASSSYTQDDIAGCWLRTAVEISQVTKGLLNENDGRGQNLQPGAKKMLKTGAQSGVSLSDGNNSEISLEAEILVLPSSDPTNKKKKDSDFKPSYQVIGLENDLKCLPFAIPAGRTDDDGFWSETRLGCAGSDYVRDFAHFILQYKLPKPIKPKKKKKEADATDPVTYPAQTTDGDSDEEDEALKSVSGILKKYNVEQASQNHWAEYANRASIITHFIYDDPSVVDIPHRHAGTGLFNMLFTGDAFEAGLDETTINASRKFDSMSMVTPRTLDTSLHDPDGNILAWLWKQELLISFKIDVLKVPHHGSSVTTSLNFYRYVSASVYLISAAARFHNHPRAETIQAIMATILQEDGPAKPPRDYIGLNDIEEVGKVGIRERPRPRLIFMTHQANYPISEREGKIQELAVEKAKEQLKGKKPKRPSSRAKRVMEPYKEVLEKYQKELEKLTDAFVKEGLLNNPTTDKKERLLKKGPFASDWLRTECPNNRNYADVPLVNARFFYQKLPNATTRLRFGRDSYRPHEVRVEWHADDWVEMRYEWDDFDKKTSSKPDEWTPLSIKYANPRNDPLAYPYPDDDAWEGGPHRKDHPEDHPIKNNNDIEIEEEK